MKANQLTPSVPMPVDGAESFAGIAVHLRNVLSEALFRLPSFTSERSIADIHEEIQFRLGSGVRSRYVASLLEFNAKLVGEVDGQRSRVASAPLSTLPDDEDHLLECLAGTWLGLYFLGIPFPHAWEAVLYFADKNGFPRGACLSKAAGDVYRSARRSNHLKGNVSPNGGLDRGSGAALQIFTLDHDIFALSTHSSTDLTQDNAPQQWLKAVSDLGRYYEFLQLRLYLRAWRGDPILRV